MEKMKPETAEVFNPEEKEKIIDQAFEGTETLEAALRKGDSIVEKEFYKKKNETDTKRIAELEEDIKRTKNAKHEALRQEQFTSEDMASVQDVLRNFEKNDRKYKFDETIVIRNTGRGGYLSDLEFSDKSVTKAGLFTGNKKGSVLSQLARVAEAMGVDLTEGKTLGEIKELVEHRIAANNTEAADADAVRQEAAKEQDLKTLIGKSATDRIMENSDKGNHQENYELVDRINEERKQLLRYRDSWQRRLFRNAAAFTDTGEFVYTNAGDRLQVVTDKKGERYLKIMEIKGGGGDPGYQSKNYSFVPLEKAKSFIAA